MAKVVVFLSVAIFVLLIACGGEGSAENSKDSSSSNFGVAGEGAVGTADPVAPSAPSAPAAAPAPGLPISAAPNLDWLSTSTRST